MENKNVVAKFGVLKNTLSTWVKDKHKLTTSLEKKRMSFSRISAHCGSYDQIDKAVFHSFVEKSGKKFQFTGSHLKKALEFVKTLGIKEFKASDCWLNKWKKRYKYNNIFLFALFCTTLNIFAKNSHHFSWAWDLQLARNLHFVPVANIDFFSSYYKCSFHILVWGKCPTIEVFFLTQTECLSITLSGSILAFSSSFTDGFHIFL